VIAWRLPLLAGLTLLILAVLLGVGAVPIPPARVAGALLGSGEGADAAILWGLRLPRTLLAGLAGAALGLSGAVMQGLFRNPLADPGLLGVSAGGAFGAVAMIVLWQPMVPPPFRPHAVALAAFAGALLVTALVLLLALRERQVGVAGLLLAGIVLNAFAGAGTSSLIYAADDMQLRDVTFWTMGSAAGATWPLLGATLTAALPLLLAAPFLARGLDALILGEREAATLGVRVEWLKWGAVALVALAVGGAVAATGLIGFVGMVAPHLVRLLGGAGHRWVLPASALLGGLLLAAADGLARTAVAPAELPVGLVTALLGAPVFLALLLRHDERGR
jgi:iron complex transport system permease protein